MDHSSTVSALQNALKSFHRLEAYRYAVPRTRQQQEEIFTLIGYVRVSLDKLHSAALNARVEPSPQQRLVDEVYGSAAR